MREIVTAVEMKELDHNTIQKAGISSPVLMERAALKTVEEIVQRLIKKKRKSLWSAEPATMAETDWRLPDCFS